MPSSRLKALAGLLLGLAVVGSPALPASADQGSSFWTDGDGIGAGVEREEPTPAPGGSSDAKPKRVCTYKRLDEEHQALSDSLAERGYGPAKGAEPGAWYRRICTDLDGGNEIGDVVWLRDRADPVGLAERALSYTALPAPTIETSPDGSQLVYVPTWLWVDASTWRPYSAEASVPGLSVTATASPKRVRWEMGNGDEVICSGPGTAYDPSKREAAQQTDCSYTYSRSSAGQPGDAYLVTATVEWHATWSDSTGGSGDLGVVRRSSTAPVRVAEVQALNQRGEP
jgi:hypothetical protein